MKRATTRTRRRLEVGQESEIRSALCGARVVDVRLHPFADGRGGVAYAPEVLLSSGDRLTFGVQETAVGRYGTCLVVSAGDGRPERPPAPDHVHYCAEPTPCRGTLPTGALGPRETTDQRLRTERGELFIALQQAAALILASGQFRAGEAAWLKAGTDAAALVRRLQGEEERV